MAVEEKQKLIKSMRRFDMLFFTVCALVGLDTLGQVTGFGAQTFTWEAIFRPDGGAAEQLRDVWIAVRANLRAVLETVTLADLAAGRLPDEVAAIAADPDAWQPH